MKFSKLSYSMLAAALIMASPVFAEGPASVPFRLDTGSQKVPMGTMLKIAFNNAMDSRISQMGEPFTASIQEDFKIHNGGDSRVILPKGTLVRGRIDQVKRPGLFSRGGSITLDFDHVTLPSGELMPLVLNLSATNDDVRRISIKGPGNPKGETRQEEMALYSDPGIGHKVNQGVQKGLATFEKIKTAGLKQEGPGVLLTAPAGIVGGAVAGTAVTAGKAAVALVGKGDSVQIQPGDTMTIDFGGSFTLPSE